MIPALLPALERHGRLRPAPGFCEIDMVAHGGTSVAGSFIQTLTMVDVATGWTECLPLLTREGALVVEAMKRPQGLLPWLIVGADFDNDSAFMNDLVVPWRRSEKIEVTHSRAYKKNDQAFVEQKNGAVVRRRVGRCGPRPRSRSSRRSRRPARPALWTARAIHGPTRPQPCLGAWGLRRPAPAPPLASGQQRQPPISVNTLR